ncbi:TonB family protein [Luteimonas sp. SJ-92]|uniref:TonB family protein n=1 Tax=Luteimonas salinisoli TaxID=2752307 RepID=A0A853JI18_9GAMM|nr:TonB family protein [Luteimonas salinisoli]NZA28229.1 TonB family protein [Luteimonas salinisoli]
MDTEFLLRWLAESTAATAVAACLVLMLRRPLRRAFGAGAAYLAWALVPAALLAASLPRPAVDSPLLQALPLHPGVLVGGAMPLDGQGAGVSDAASAAALLSAWAVGAVLLGLRLVARQRRFNAALGALRRRPDGAWESSGGQGPAVVGVWRPRIVVPPDFDARYPKRQAALILEHERVHARRGDVPASLAATVLRCLYWFNPLLHAAAARFRLDQELACDAAVLARHPGAGRSYGYAMLNTQLAVPGLPAGCHWQSSQSLKERITMLGNPQPGVIRRHLGSSMLCVLLAGSAYAVWAVRPALATASPAAPASSLQAGPAAAGAERAPAAARPAGAGIADAGAGDGGPDSVTPPPRYPAAAVAAKQSGRVVLRLLVGVDGSVKDVVVEASEPAGVFDAATIDAARQWKIAPRMQEGEAIEGWVRVPVTFEIPPEEPAGNAVDGVAPARAADRHGAAG